MINNYMKKFNLDSLEKTFSNINDLSKNINDKKNNIIKKTYKKCNNKSIETILFFILLCFENEYDKISKEYYKNINFFSDNYLIGSDWYIGPEYTKEYYFNQLDLDVQYKYTFLICLLNYMYDK
uniref:Uncharacterized protein n=1 Tax=viral metagenome TaxID=1070528 RepID=A0A6C0C890_9ZZZZ